MNRRMHAATTLAAFALLALTTIGCGGDAEPYAAPDYAPDETPETTETTETSEAAEVTPLSELALDVDPFCGMQLKEGEVTVTAEYDGKTYGFCCTHCRDQFLADPAGRLAIHANREARAEARGEETP